MAIEVQTTQNVTIDYERAGVGYRLLAYVLDWIFIILWILGCYGIYYLFDDLLSSVSLFDSTFGIILLLFSAIPVFFYDLIFETMNNGQSLGKMLLKIRVVNTDGTAPSFGSYLLRWLFRVIDFSMSEGLVGVVMIVATKKSQRLGDYLAGTTVIDLKINSKNRDLSITDLDFHEDYKVTYFDVLDKLSDRDIQTIISILNDQRVNSNDYLSKRLADRTKLITGYTYDGPDQIFLKKLIDDYNYLALQQT